MLTFLYITLFFNSLESPFSGRPGHVPWREVSSHLIALILGIYKKLSIIHIQIFFWALMFQGMAESVSSKYATGLKLYREALLIRCCKGLIRRSLKQTSRAKKGANKPL